LPSFAPSTQPRRIVLLPGFSHKMLFLFARELVPLHLPVPPFGDGAFHWSLLRSCFPLLFGWFLFGTFDRCGTTPQRFGVVDPLFLRTRGRIGVSPFFFFMFFVFFFLFSFLWTSRQSWSLRLSHGIWTPREAAGRGFIVPPATKKGPLNSLWILLFFLMGFFRIKLEIYFFGDLIPFSFDWISFMVFTSSPSSFFLLLSLLRTSFLCFCWVRECFVVWGWAFDL